MLIGRVNRHDRLAIVREVETQIFDLLQGRDAGNLDRDDVIAVLARLDPPEAYLPDEAIREAAPDRVSTSPRPVQRPTQPTQSRLPKISGVLGIVATSAVFLDTFLLMFCINMSSHLGNIANTVLELSLFGLAGLGLLLGLLAVITASASRLRGGWAITGLVTGIVSMLGSMLILLFIIH